MNRFCIRDRIDAALEKMAWQRMEVRAIYLTEADLKQLNRLLSKEFGRGFKLHACGYRDHILRTGKESTIYSTHGVEVVIPKRLSHRVAEQVAA
ncbi:MAG: hypothetical protein V4696_01680 [Pseudomonadota bacterium]